MSNTVSGSFSAAVNLTTKFGSGTAGQATEISNFGGVPIQVGASQPSGLQFTVQWSQTWTNLTGTTTLDLTNLTGVNGGAVSFSALRLIHAINSDPTAGNNVQVGPGATNGLVAPFDSSTGYDTVPGGMPGAGVTSTPNGQTPIGNVWLQSNCTPTGWVVDSTHKTLQLAVPSGTVASFTLILAG